MGQRGTPARNTEWIRDPPVPLGPGAPLARRATGGFLFAEKPIRGSFALMSHFNCWKARASRVNRLFQAAALAALDPPKEVFSGCF